jgi:hypothetical protein
MNISLAFLASALVREYVRLLLEDETAQDLEGWHENMISSLSIWRMLDLLGHFRRLPAIPLLSLRFALLGHNLANIPISLVDSNHIGVRRIIL